MNNARITVQVDVEATPRQAWEAFTNDEAVVVWNHASDDWHCPAATSDLRPGGRFSQTMAAKDGSVSFEMTGEYTDVEAPYRLAYTMEDGRRVEVGFAEQPDGTTQVTETFDPEDTNPAEVQRGGWQAILDNYRDYANEYAQSQG